ARRLDQRPRGDDPAVADARLARLRPPSGRDRIPGEVDDRVTRAHRPGDVFPADRSRRGAPRPPADHGHGVALARQPSAEWLSDEAASTGDEHAHGLPQSVCVEWKRRFPRPEKRARLLRSMLPRKAGKSWKKRLRRAARRSK